MIDALAAFIWSRTRTGAGHVELVDRIPRGLAVLFRTENVGCEHFMDYESEQFISPLLFLAIFINYYYLPLFSLLSIYHYYLYYYLPLTALLYYLPLTCHHDISTCAVPGSQGSAQVCPDISRSTTTSPLSRQYRALPVSPATKKVTCSWCRRAKAVALLGRHRRAS